MNPNLLAIISILADYILFKTSSFPPKKTLKFPAWPGTARAASQSTCAAESLRRGPQGLQATDLGFTLWQFNIAVENHHLKR